MNKSMTLTKMNFTARPCADFPEGCLSGGWGSCGCRWAAVGQAGRYGPELGAVRQSCDSFE